MLSWHSELLGLLIATGTELFESIQNQTVPYFPFPKNRFLKKSNFLWVNTDYFIKL